MNWGHDFAQVPVHGRGGTAARTGGPRSELWYFNGEPGNGAHPTRTTVTTPATRGGTTFRWDVIDGARQVELVGGGSSSSLSTGWRNQVQLRSRQGSSGEDEVRIRATETGVDGHVMASSVYQLGVRTPAAVHRIGETTAQVLGARLSSGAAFPPRGFPVESGMAVSDSDFMLPRADETGAERTEEPTAAPKSLSSLATTHSASSSWGYETRVTYQVLDDKGAVMTGYDVNECWSTGVVNDTRPCDWRRGPAGSFHVAGDRFDDLIGGESPGHIPAPTAPSGGTTRVQHWGQQWYVGSLTPGRGTLVQTNTLQKYRDHGAHESVTSPLGLGSRIGTGLRRFFGLD